MKCGSGFIIEVDAVGFICSTAPSLLSRIQFSSLDRCSTLWRGTLVRSEGCAGVPRKFEGKKVKRRGKKKE
jgi:hypothetical protein